MSLISASITGSKVVFRDLYYNSIITLEITPGIKDNVFSTCWVERDPVTRSVSEVEYKGKKHKVISYDEVKNVSSWYGN